MKRKIILIFQTVSILFSMIANGQTANHKLGCSAGFGFQQYKGELGNGFYSFNMAKYGVAKITLDYYLNKSFNAGIMSTLGDYGFCQGQTAARKEIPLEDRCPGCVGRPGMANLSSRLLTFGVFVEYKINNGYLIPAESRIQPYLYAGAAFNHITDVMKNNCVIPGDYYSVNGGLGVKYHFNGRASIGYNVGFGYFANHQLQKMSGNDMYMQNTLFLGIDLF
jgi:hypothetical protein